MDEDNEKKGFRLKCVT